MALLRKYALWFTFIIHHDKTSPVSGCSCNCCNFCLIPASNVCAVGVRSQYSAFVSGTFLVDGETNEPAASETVISILAKVVVFLKPLYFTLKNGRRS